MAVKILFFYNVFTICVFQYFQLRYQNLQIALLNCAIYNFIKSAQHYNNHNMPLNSLVHTLSQLVVYKITSFQTLVSIRQYINNSKEAYFINLQKVCIKRVYFHVLNVNIAILLSYIW